MSEKTDKKKPLVSKESRPANKIQHVNIKNLYGFAKSISITELQDLLYCLIDTAFSSVLDSYFQNDDNMDWDLIQLNKAGLYHQLWIIVSDILNDELQQTDLSKKEIPKTA